MFIICLCEFICNITILKYLNTIILLSILYKCSKWHCKSDIFSTLFQLVISHVRLIRLNKKHFFTVFILNKKFIMYYVMNGR